MKAYDEKMSEFKESIERGLEIISRVNSTREWKERVKRSEAKKEAAEAKRERRRQRNLKLSSLIMLFSFYFLEFLSNGHGII